MVADCVGRVMREETGVVFEDGAVIFWGEAMSFGFCAWVRKHIFRVFLLRWRDL